ncbi:MAG: magnesium-transporting ATPase (P-type) [Lentisphaeria bacterium]|jgi:magnesium-transporting ATPase (P-type)
MITAVILAFEPPEHNVIQRSPRNAHEPILTHYLIWRVAFVSVILMSGTFCLFQWELDRGMSVGYARTVAVNTLVMFEIFYLFNSRYINNSALNWSGITGNRYVLIAISMHIIFQLGFTYLNPMQSLFGTTSVDVDVLLRIVVISSSVFFLVELEKYILRSWAHYPK